MTAQLVYSLMHKCSNSGEPMVWQPAGRRWYCVQCRQVEDNATYLPCRLTKKVLDNPEVTRDDTPPTDQPEPPRYA